MQLMVHLHASQDTFLIRNLILSFHLRDAFTDYIYSIQNLCIKPYNKEANVIN